MLKPDGSAAHLTCGQRLLVDQAGCSSIVVRQGAFAGADFCVNNHGPSESVDTGPQAQQHTLPAITSMSPPSRCLHASMTPPTRAAINGFIERNSLFLTSLFFHLLGLSLRSFIAGATASHHAGQQQLRYVNALRARSSPFEMFHC
jgi:hypothetical protein